MIDDHGSYFSARSTEPSIGETLRALRKAKQLTGQQLGLMVGMSQAKISRIETGVVLADFEDVLNVARALEASEDIVQRLRDQTARAQVQMTEWPSDTPDQANRQREFGDLEIDARELRIFQPAVVVGLLQTSEYARAILANVGEHSRRPETSGSSLSKAVAGRIGRQTVLADADKSFEIIMTEAVLRNRLTGPAVMLAQIERIREVAAQDNTGVRFVEDNAQLPAPPYHGFELFDDRCVTVDLFNTTILSRVKSDIKLYRLVFDELERVATTEIDPILDRYTDLYMRRLTTRVARQSAQPA